MVGELGCASSAGRSSKLVVALLLKAPQSSLPQEDTKPSLHNIGGWLRWKRADGRGVARTQSCQRNPKYGDAYTLAYFFFPKAFSKEAPRKLA